MDRGLPASHIGPVHQVIMQQCEIVEYLHSCSRTENTFNIIGIHVVGHYEKCGTYALASKRKDISYGSVQFIGLT